MEHIEAYLTTSVKNALWDLTLETHVLPLDLAPPTGAADELSSVYSDLLVKWFDACCPTSPSLNKSTITFSGKTSISKSTVSDLQHQV